LFFRGFEIELEETSSRDSDEIQDGGHAAKMAETSASEMPAGSSHDVPKPEGSPRPRELSIPETSDIPNGEPISNPATPTSVDIARRSAAVTVRGGYLSYVKNVPVLNNFNMTVPEGSM